LLVGHLRESKTRRRQYHRRDDHNFFHVNVSSSQV
jgi:hypothetical protein